MRKILLIGSGGSGKSTLAAKIAERTGLPLIHLDAIYWKPGWVDTPRDEWTRIVAGMVTRDAWVMDGNYGGTMDIRLAACDTVIFLDFPRMLCLWRVLKRRFRFRNQSRPDMAADCPEHLSREFLMWIWNYRRDRRPSILQKLAALGQDQRVIILDSPGKAEAFIAQLPTHE